MDTNTPNNGRRDRRSSPGYRPVITQSRSSRRRRRSVWPTVLVVTTIVVVLGVLGYFGAQLMMRPKAGSAAALRPAATTSAAATTSGGGAEVATPTPKPSSSKSTTTGATGASSPATAWRDADPSWMNKYRGKLVDGFKTEPGYKAVALTFDDGPNFETKYVIKTLKKYGGQATFFDSGRNLARSWAGTQPSMIWDAGFELANHTQHHTINNVSSMWHRSYAVDLAEIKGPDVFAMRGTGRNTVWLRPMGGMIDATGIKAAVDTNHLVINWTVDSNDSHGGPRTPDYIYNTVTTGISSGDVVLLHVTHPESMKALPRICATLTQRGFKLVTVSELAQHSTAAITQRIPK
jgi:peptidoglycan/xylan/chitin deacetylase (PgdA/CDA1 family)